MNSTPHAHHLAMHHDPQAAATAFRAFEEHHIKEVEKAQSHRNYAWAAGRILLGLVFVGGAVAKALNFDPTATAMDDFGLRGAPILLSIAILIEGVAGVMLMLGAQTRRAAIAMVLWLTTVTVVVHGNLSLAENRAAALANLAIIAAVLFLYSHGAGKLSVDHHRARASVSN